MIIQGVIRQIITIILFIGFSENFTESPTMLTAAYQRKVTNLCKISEINLIWENLKNFNFFFVAKLLVF